MSIELRKRSEGKSEAKGRGSRNRTARRRYSKLHRCVLEQVGFCFFNEPPSYAQILYQKSGEFIFRILSPALESPSQHAGMSSYCD